MHTADPGGTLVLLSAEPGVTRVSLGVAKKKKKKHFNIDSVSLLKTRVVQVNELFG